MAVQAVKGLRRRFYAVIDSAQGNRGSCVRFSAVWQADGLHPLNDRIFQFAVFPERRLLPLEQRGKKIVKFPVLELGPIPDGKRHDFGGR